MHCDAAVHLAKKAQDTASHIMLTLPPVLLADLTPAPWKSCTCSRLCCQVMVVYVSL